MPGPEDFRAPGGTHGRIIAASVRVFAEQRYPKEKKCPRPAPAVINC
ncbi:hypothetical protein Pd630_LPD07097 [Rhodococcus opacus PD630]|nr:hypothetical protein Pd630_LPD07097 [Rhodococcus opacus PD630]